jgi:hypothetical protein
MLQCILTLQILDLNTAKAKTKMLQHGAWADIYKGYARLLITCMCFILSRQRHAFPLHLWNDAVFVLLQNYSKVGWLVVLVRYTRDENGRNFSRIVPFRFLYFSVRFRICEIPFSYFAEVENGVFRSFPSNPILIRNRPVFILFLSRFQSMLNMFNNYMSLCYVNII